jgi:ketosteroid isomerase-like protein
VSGDLACVVEIERYRPVGSDTLTSARTRATHIFRREEGAWKLAHRHMDHLREDTTPRAAQAK